MEREGPEAAASVQDSVDQLFRHSAGYMVATLARIFGLEHLERIEDAVQDAFVCALKRWPYGGAPDTPLAWLVQVAKNRLLDRLRREGWREVSGADVGLPGLPLESDGQIAFAGELLDDQLRMMFTCCHPVIPRDGQIALTLKVTSGFSVAEIARALLSREAAVARGITRAKARLREHAVRLELPTPDRLPARLDAVLEVLYLLFNEGYAAAAGEDLVRADLCHEAIRLCELLAGHPLMGRPKVHALAALLAFQGARLGGRSDRAGELLLLSEQERSHWDRGMIARGLAHFRASARGAELTAYHLEAEIASCHALAPGYAATDWERVLGCYEALYRMNPSPVVALNRAVARARARGPGAGLEDLQLLLGSRRLDAYVPLHVARAELLGELGRREEANAAYRRALELTSSAPLRRHLVRRMGESSPEH